MQIAEVGDTRYIAFLYFLREQFCIICYDATSIGMKSTVDNQKIENNHGFN